MGLEYMAYCFNKYWIMPENYRQIKNNSRQIKVQDMNEKTIMNNKMIRHMSLYNWHINNCNQCLYYYLLNF
jgi:hypothetical protein